MREASFDFFMIQGVLQGASSQLDLTNKLERGRRLRRCSLQKTLFHEKVERSLAQWHSALPFHEASVHFCAKPYVLHEASAHAACAVQIVRVFTSKAQKDIDFQLIRVLRAFRCAGARKRRVFTRKRTAALIPTFTCFNV